MRQSTRRTLAVLALVAVLAVAATLSASGFLLSDAMHTAIADKQSQLAQLRNEISRLAREAPIEKAQPNAPTNLLLPAMSTGAAGADLQSRLMKIVASEQGRVVSARVVPQEPEDGLQRITIDMAFESDIAATRDILVEIERDAPLAFVEHLSVRRLARSRKAKQVANTAEPLLAVSLKVSNYMSTDAGANGQ